MASVWSQSNSIHNFISVTNVTTVTNSNFYPARQILFQEVKLIRVLDLWIFAESEVVEEIAHDLRLLLCPQDCCPHCDFHILLRRDSGVSASSRSRLAILGSCIRSVDYHTFERHHHTQVSNSFPTLVAGNFHHSVGSLEDQNFRYMLDGLSLLHSLAGLRMSDWLHQKTRGQPSIHFIHGGHKLLITMCGLVTVAGHCTCWCSGSFSRTSCLCTEQRPPSLGCWIWGM